MGLFGKKKIQRPSITEVIRYGGANDVLFWRFPNEDFNTNTQLIVGPSQEAIFVKGGQVLGRFVSGTYTLNTKNYPFIRVLVGLVTNGVPPFYCEVYYVNKHISLRIDWGTDNPISIIDPIYHVPIDVQSYGNLSLQIENGQKLIEMLHKQMWNINQHEITELFSDLVNTKVRGILSNILLMHGLSPIGIDAHLADISMDTARQLQRVFDSYGMLVDNCTVVAINAPDLDIIKQKARDLQAHRMETDVVAEDNRKLAQLKKPCIPQTHQSNSHELLFEETGDVRKGSEYAGAKLDGVPDDVDDDINALKAEIEEDSFVMKARKLKYLLDNGMITQDHYQRQINSLLDKENDSMGQVQFSALAPKTIRKGEYIIIDIMMYELSWRHVVDEFIHSSESQLQEVRSGFIGASGKTSVRIAVSSQDIVIEDNEETQVWRGGYLRFSFAGLLPQQYPKQQILITARVYVDDVIKTKLQILVSCEAKYNKGITLNRKDVISAFASYASQDRKRVAAIIQGMKKINADMDVFFDVENLHSGDEWEQILYQEISKRDVLFLFWSRSARESKWVETEWRYALVHKGIDFIEPVPIESPELCPPPEELGRKHFNDKLLYIINSKQ